MAWSLVVHGIAGGAQIDGLTAATDRKLVVKLGSGPELSFQVSGRHRQVELIGPGLTRDILVSRDGVALERVRVIRPHRKGDGRTHMTQVSCLGYRELLARRMLMGALSYTAIDQGTIAWNLIAHIQAQTGGNMGITQGTTTTGILRDRSFTAGQYAGQEIERLSKAADGFDWEIDADLAFQVFHPQRGTDTQETLRFSNDGPSNCAEWEEIPDPAGFANALRVTAPGSLTPEVRLMAGLSTAETGRFDRQVGLTGVVDQDQLAEQADGLSADQGDFGSILKMRLRRGHWKGRSHIWVGDTVRAVVKDGYTSIVESLRVQEMEFTDLDNADGETVDVTLGRPGLDERIEALNTEERLTRLESA